MGLFNEIKSCELCKGIKGYKNYPVPTYVGKRYNEKRIFIIGQNPGKNYNILNDIKNTKSEEEFYSLFKKFLNNGNWKILNNWNWVKKGLKLDFDQIAFTDLYKCPCEEKNEKSRNKMKDNCARFLLREIEILDPKILITIGSQAREFIIKNKNLSSNKKIYHFRHTSRFNPLNEWHTIHNIQL